LPHHDLEHAVTDADRRDPETPAPEHRVPDDVSSATVEAVGKLSEAIEWIERARGHLYDFHQMSGRADLLLGEAAEALREAGHAQVADRLEHELVGRNLLEGRWSFQIVEEYDDTYWSPARALDQEVRDELTQGRRHLFEAQMKESRRTRGHPHHTARPR
jgi:hypothetical protein